MGLLFKRESTLYMLLQGGVYMPILRCYGGNSLSPDKALVSMFGETKLIEEWYQYSKHVTGKCPPGVWCVPCDLADGYGLAPDYFEVNNIRFETGDLSRWYLYLWYMFFLQNPNKLVQ